MVASSNQLFVGLEQGGKRGAKGPPGVLLACTCSPFASTGTPLCRWLQSVCVFGVAQQTRLCLGAALPRLALPCLACLAYLPSTCVQPVAESEWRLMQSSWPIHLEDVSASWVCPRWWNCWVLQQQVE